MRWQSPKGSIELKSTENVEVDSKEIFKQLEIALEHYQSGGMQEADVICHAILKKYPQHSDALHLLGLIEYQTGEYNRSIELFERAISINQNNPAYYNNCGISYQALDKFDLAAIRYEKALVLKPDFVEAYINMGALFNQQNQFTKAISYFEQALKFKTYEAEAYCNIGYALTCLGQPEKSIKYLELTLNLKPNFVEALINKGTAYLKLGQLDDSTDCFNRVMELNPDNPKALFNLSFIKLLTGNYEQGWIDFEWRFKAKSANVAKRFYSKPEWNGTSLKLKTILIYYEQGLGDTIQFVRYIFSIHKKAKKIIIQVPDRIKRLFSQLSDYATVIGMKDDIPEFDVHISLMSLPRILKTTADTIPDFTPYLKPEIEKLNYWTERLSNIKEKKIGIAWQGTPTHHNDKYRSLPLSHFEQFLDLKDIKLISLQKGNGIEQLKQSGLDTKVVSFDNECDIGTDGFIDTVAILANLELLVTCDTAVAHLAGAMGKPVWVLLPFVPDWRWLLNRTDSPWYPSMRLFRQTERGDWESVFDEVKIELNKLINN